MSEEKECVKVFKQKAEKGNILLNANNIIGSIPMKTNELSEGKVEDSSESPSCEILSKGSIKNMQDTKGLIQKHYWTKEEVLVANS
jgi:hypothetical protein